METEENVIIDTVKWYNFPEKSRGVINVPKALAEINEKMASVGQNDSEYLMEIKKFIEDLGNV